MSKYRPSIHTGNPELPQGGLSKAFVKGRNEEDKLRLLAAVANEQASTNELIKEQTAEAKRHNQLVEHEIAEQTELILEDQRLQQEERLRAADWRKLVAAVGDSVAELDGLHESRTKTIAIAVLLHRIEELISFENTEISLNEILVAKDLLKSTKSIETAHMKAIGETRTTAECSTEIANDVGAKLRVFRESFVGFAAKAQDAHKRITEELDENEYLTLCRGWDAEVDAFQLVYEQAYAYFKEVMGLLPFLTRWEIFVTKTNKEESSICVTVFAFGEDSEVEAGWNKHIELLAKRSEEIDALLADKSALRENYMTACASCDFHRVLEIRNKIGNFRIFSGDNEVSQIEAPILKIVASLSTFHKNWSEVSDIIKQTAPRRIYVSSNTRNRVCNNFESLRHCVEEIYVGASSLKSQECVATLKDLTSQITQQIGHTNTSWLKLCRNLKGKAIVISVVFLCVMFWSAVLLRNTEIVVSSGGKIIIGCLWGTSLIGLLVTNIGWITRVRPLNEDFVSRYSLLAELHAKLVRVVGMTEAFCRHPPRLTAR